MWHNFAISRPSPLKWIRSSCFKISVDLNKSKYSWYVYSATTMKFIKIDCMYMYMLPIVFD